MAISHRDTSVMLVFQPPNTGKLYKNQFPVVWKTFNLRAGGHGKAIVRYTNRLGSGYAQIDEDNAVASSAWTEIHSKETREGTSPIIVCENNSGDRADLVIGFIKGDEADQKFEPTLVCSGVNADSKITTQFTPVLQAYATRDYQESQLLRGEVETDIIWEQNISELDDVTGWNFYEDEASGQFSITPAARA
ncbi:hypothetical protein FRC09_019737 [Ceratobasidium sp. 395]|nr:hypothetical protein FRC09_019737 [Ceratobasidium sp. 395]